LVKIKFTMSGDRIMFQLAVNDNPTSFAGGSSARTLKRLTGVTARRALAQRPFGAYRHSEHIAALALKCMAVASVTATLTSISVVATVLCLAGSQMKGIDSLSRSETTRQLQPPVGRAWLNALQKPQHAPCTPGKPVSWR
jgi:hypothetical protein